MKLLAFSDVHLSAVGLEAIEKKARDFSPDYMVCAGDLTIFEKGLSHVMDRLAKIGIPFLAVHGNHESESVFKKAMDRHKGFHFLHKKAVDVDGVLFVGYGGGGFSQIEPGFEEWTGSVEPRIERFDKVVLVTHAPPHKTRLDEIAPGSHAGVKSYRSWIMNHNLKVKLAVSGHIHETAGREDVVGRARVVNPGPRGKIIHI